MSTYGQYCPLSKTMDILGEPWTILILRELLTGSSTLKELHRGLSKMPCSLLLERMEHLEDSHLVIHTQQDEEYEYQLTPAGTALGPAIVQLAKWGAEHLLIQISENELDTQLLMLEIQRHFNREYLTENNVCIHIHFPEQSKYSNWWVLANKYRVKVCHECLFVDADIHIICSLHQFTNIWLGNTQWEDAVLDDSIAITGQSGLIKLLPLWFGYSYFAPFNPRACGKSIDSLIVDSIIC